MWPFKRRMPFPPVIHPNDIDLVGPRDLEWWSQQSIRGVNSLLEQDNVFVVAKIRDCFERGMSEEGTAKEVQRWFPNYYFLSLDHRQADRLAKSDDDRPMPVTIKDRINRANMNASIGQRLTRELPQATSANAWYRAAIRRNEI